MSDIIITITVPRVKEKVKMNPSSSFQNHTSTKASKLNINDNNAIIEETAYEWLERSIKSTSPYSKTIDSFLLCNTNKIKYYNRYPIKIQ